VVTSANTGNGASTYTYDNMDRVTSVKDPNGNTTGISNTPTSTESTLNFSTTSTVDTLATVDDLGRPHISQRKQSQTGSYDSTEITYNALGLPYQVSVPYSAAGGAGYSGSNWTATTYDAMSRVHMTTDSDGGTQTFSYSANDVLRTLTPAPSGETSKSAQYQYDGLGRLSSVCEITSASGSVACSQNTSATGYFTSYTYNALNELTGVSQSGQTRTYGFDALGRLTSETNPEAGTSSYTYDSDSTCGSSPGDMVKKVDAIGNVICFHYDTIHRLTSTTYPSGSCSSSTPEKVFVYDSATVNGNPMQNTEGRLAEAYTCTGSCSTKITDLGFSYDADGNVTQVWQSTPHSGGYYEAKAATYWPNGLPETLQLLNNSGGALIPTVSYAPDGEGRVSSTSVSGGQNPLTSASYNIFSEATALDFGSADSDGFSYDTNTGRLTQYNFNVNGKTVTGNVGWNANGTLATLGITDPYDSSNSQSCAYKYDPQVRLASANCGSIWSQTFSFDPFGNLSKSGTISFQPTYNTSTNQVSKVGGLAPGYDADGNTTSDTVNSYNWDSDGNMIKAVTPSATTQVTYDARDRAVEFEVGSSYTQIVYGPGGSKLALMSGQTLSKAFVPLAGGATAVYNSSGLAYYRHPDWLGSSRLASTTSRGVYYDGAYAPYGENYAETGTTDRSLTAQNQDMVSSGSYPLYDFLMREHNAAWGRWISPDPAGLGATNPANPQTWDRYAYVANNPLGLIDPLGLFPYGPFSPPSCGNVPSGIDQAAYLQCLNAWKIWASSGDAGAGGCMAGEYGCGGGGGSPDSGSPTPTYGEDIFDALAGDNGTTVWVNANGNIGFTVNLNPQGGIPGMTQGGPGTGLYTVFSGNSNNITAPTYATYTLETAASNSGFSMNPGSNPNFQPAGFVCVTCGPWTDGGTRPAPKARAATAPTTPTLPTTSWPVLPPLPVAPVPVAPTVLLPLPWSP